MGGSAEAEGEECTLLRMHLLRLRGRKICERLLRQGKVWKGKHMLIRWMEGHPRHPASRLTVEALYIGTLASTKLDKSAVNRNRMRRRCREALRLLVKENSFSLSTTALSTPATSSAIQLLIAPRSSSLKAPFSELVADMMGFLSSRSRSHGSTQTAR
jgi:ribonuclease P protein component